MPRHRVARRVSFSAFVRAALTADSVLERALLRAEEVDVFALSPVVDVKIAEVPVPKRGHGGALFASAGDYRGHAPAPRQGRKGVAKSAPRSQYLEAVEQFTNRLEVVPFSLRAAAKLAKLGTLCGAYDMLIVAHAPSEGLMLVTNNLGEFQRIPGLRVDNWV